MLQPRLTTCSECTNISLLIEKIDCKMAKIASILYGNTVYMLNSSLSAVTIIDLLNYKRILTFKQVNPAYCEEYSIDDISSRINILIYK